MLTRIAFRNVLRNRRRSAITLLVIVFGATGLILFGGYKQQTFRGLRESTIRSRVGHLQIYRRGFAAADARKPMELGLENVGALRAVVEKDRRVKMTAAQITLMGLISNGDKSETFVAVAVEPQKDRAMQSQRIVSGTALPDGEPDAVILGRGLAASMHAKAGDYLTLMTTTSTGSLNAIDVRVAGIFMSGIKEYDDRAVKMPIAGAQQLLLTKKVERLIVMLNDTDDTSAVHSDLMNAFKQRGWQIEMKEWSELATFYHQVVRLYNGIFGFLGLIVSAIVVFSVANTIVMAIFERTREIGTLMAIGTSRSRVARMFLAEGVVIGVLGAIAGVSSGVLLSIAINHAHLMLPPPPGYTVGYPLQVLLQPRILIFAAVVSMVTSTISSIVPAIKASRLQIVDALGHI